MTTAGEFDHDLWGLVVPHGPSYCHWGGIEQSKRLVDALALRKCDRLLELCCGAGGLLQLVQTVRFAYGVDISQKALEHANRKNKTKNIAFVRCDAARLPFADRSFTKVVAQDADAWIRPSKHELMAEVCRVMDEEGLFVFQTYACSGRLTSPQRMKTEHLLHACGYRWTDVPVAENIPQMFLRAGFQIDELTSLHSVYVRDNERMLRQFVANEAKLRTKFAARAVDSLHKLLRWEATLFAERLWTGIQVTASKAPS